MANQKITDLRSLNLDTVSNEDLIPIVDVSENTSPTGELKKISVNQFTIALQNRVGAGIDDKINLFTSTNFIPIVQKGVADGVAPLNALNKIDDVYINFPAGAVSSIFGRGGVVTANVNDYSGSYVLKTGDTVLGPLNVQITPTFPSHSVSKLYTDNISSSINNSITFVSASTTLYVNSISSSITDRITANSSSFSVNLTNLSSSVVSISSSTAIRINGKQDIIGFSPVQQGGGIGQTSDKVYIGASGSRLVATVGSTNLGGIVFDSNLISDGIYKLPEYQQMGGSYYSDGVAFVDMEKNIRMCGSSQSQKYGFVDSYASPYNTMPLPLNEKAAKLYLGPRNIWCISETGIVYASGYNGEGQCATGNTTQQTSLTQCIGLPTTVTSLTFTTDADGACNIYALTTDGKVYAWGYNQYGNLGDGTTTVRSTPVLSIGPGNTYGNPGTAVTQIVSQGGNDGSSIPETAIALLSDGTVYCVGYGGRGQMGNSTTTVTNSTWKRAGSLTNIVKVGICAGDAQTGMYALNSSGAIFAWGVGNNGQLGNNATTDLSAPTQMLTTNITSPNIVDFWTCMPYSNTGCIFVKNSDGAMYSCGYNGQGQLGLGDTTERRLLTRITSLNGYTVSYLRNSFHYAHVVAVVTGNAQVQLLMTGHNGQAQLGTGDTTDRSSFTAIRFNQTSGIADVRPDYCSGVGGTTMVLTNDRNLYMCGITRYGRMSSRTDLNVYSLKKVTKHATG